MTKQKDAGFFFKVHSRFWTDIIQFAIVKFPDHCNSVTVVVSCYFQIKSSVVLVRTLNTKDMGQFSFLKRTSIFKGFLPLERSNDEIFLQLFSKCIA